MCDTAPTPKTTTPDLTISTYKTTIQTQIYSLYCRLGPAPGRYRLLIAWPRVLILLPIVPSCMRLARASSRADCVTEASNQPQNQKRVSEPDIFPLRRRKRRKEDYTVKVTKAAPHTWSPIASLARLALILTGASSRQFGRSPRR